MVCIYCGHETQVINSRPQKRTNQIWRRRKCQRCAAVFTTNERVDTESSLRVQNHGVLEPFSRDKLLIDIYDSLRHRKTALRDASALTQTVWSQLQGPIDEGLLDREEIIKTTSAVLRRFDKAAASHYLAFHPL